MDFSFPPNHSLAFVNTNNIDRDFIVEMDTDLINSSDFSEQAWMDRIIRSEFLHFLFRIEAEWTELQKYC